MTLATTTATTTGQVDSTGVPVVFDIASVDIPDGGGRQHEHRWWRTHRLHVDPG